MSQLTHFVPKKDDIRHGYECEVRRMLPKGLMERAMHPDNPPRFAKDWDAVTIGVSEQDRLPANADMLAQMQAWMMDMDTLSKPIEYLQAQFLILHGMIRTPYLTKDALVADGWEITDSVGHLIICRKDGFTMSYRTNNCLTIIESDSDRVFHGNLRCINDLRLIEEMISIHIPSSDED